MGRKAFKDFAEKDTILRSYTLRSKLIALDQLLSTGLKYKSGPESSKLKIAPTHLLTLILTTL